MASPAHSYEKDQVLKIIDSVVAKVQGSETPVGDNVVKEISDLQKIIREARSEIAQARPNDISSKHIPTATDELDAIVEATAAATGTIMDSCEVIMEKAGNAGDAADEITQETTKIFEACSFQDITGQRITKIVTTLKTIEDKVGRIITALGADLPEGIDKDDDSDDERGEMEKLLNGPQMADKAISQADIDALLAEFDE